MNANVKRPKKGFLQIFPHGGCSEFGMNVTSFYNSRAHILVDCGGMFPDEHKLGVDFIFPNVDAQFKEIGVPDAYFITHGHEDHVGAIVQVYAKYPAPIYTRPWTAEIIRQKFEQSPVASKLKKKPQVRIVNLGDQVEIKDMKVEWVPMNHSIPEACALFFQTPEGNIFFTADFKFDPVATHELPVSGERLQSYSKRGIDVLMADSTGALSPGRCAGEASIKGELKRVIDQCEGAAIVSTFASNLWRVLTVLEIAEASGRRIAIMGRGLDRTIEIATRLNYLKRKVQLISPAEIAKTKQRDQILVLATGCQGEQFAATSRMTRGEHKDFKLKPGDGLILSSRVIPGNEKSILRMMNAAQKLGVRVITANQNPGIHVSGHANQEDIKELVSYLKPRHYIPIHGSHAHLLSNVELGVQAGLAREQCHFIESGARIRLESGSIKVESPLFSEWMYVDSGSGVALPSRVLNQRLRLGETGGLFLACAIGKKKRRFVQRPEFQWIGLPGNEEGVGRSNLEKDLVAEMDNLLREQETDLGRLKEQMRRNLRSRCSDFFHKKIEVYLALTVI